MSEIKRRAIARLIGHDVRITLSGGRALAPNRVVTIEDDVVELADGSFFSLSLIASVERVNAHLTVSQAESPIAESQPAPAAAPAPVDGPVQTFSLADPSFQPVAPAPQAATLYDQGANLVTQRALESQALPFLERLSSYSWTASAVPPLPKRSMPALPSTLERTTFAKQYWNQATNYLTARNFAAAAREFLAFSALVPSSLEPIWGAALCADQLGDPIKALAILQWRPHLLSNSSELLRAAVSLADRLHMPQTVLRLLRAHREPPNDLELDFVFQACGYGLDKQVAAYLDDKLFSSKELEDPFSAYLLLRLVKRTPRFDLTRLPSFRLDQIIPVLLRELEDIPTAAYERKLESEGNTTEKIRTLHEEFRNLELATRERISLGIILPKVQEARRRGNYSEARQLASAALQQAESPHWRKQFQEQLTGIDRENPPLPRLEPRRALAAQTTGRPTTLRRAVGPLWQQASDASVAGDTELAISLYTQYLKEGKESGKWPERGDQAVNGLAVVYNRVGRRKDAIEVMLTYRREVQARFAFHNQLATLFFLIGDYASSAQEFGRAMEVSPGSAERLKAQANQRNAAARAGTPGKGAVKADSALGDSDAKELEREYLTIDYLTVGVSAAIRMAEVTLAIDPFIEADLDRITESGAKLTGVERARIAREDFDFHTVRDLERRAERSQTTQGFRSQYLATALWIVYDRKWHTIDTGGELGDLRVLQTRFAASLGDDAAAQSRNDVAREYYAFVLERNPLEALALAKVRDYMRTMTGERFTSGTEKYRWDELRKLLDGQSPGGISGARIACWAVVHIAGLSNSSYNAVLKALDGDAIRQSLSEAIARYIPGSSSGPEDFNKRLADAVSLVNSHEAKIFEQFKRFEGSGLTIASLQNTAGGDVFAGFDTDLPFNVLDFGDQGRVPGWRTTVLAGAHNYLTATSPSDKELRFEVVVNAIDSALERVLSHPTRFGRRVLLPLLGRLRSDLGDHFIGWKTTVAPEIAVAIEGTRESEGFFEIDVLITNAPQRRAAQEVEVGLSAPGWSLTRGFSEAGGLDGGARRSQRWRLEKRHDVVAPATLAAIAEILYRTDGEQRTARIEVEIPLRAVPYEAWVSPYHPGPPVESDFMLKGRDVEVTLLTSGVSRVDRSTFFRVIGPRRTGKSSILEAVRRRLLERADSRLFVTQRFDIKSAGSQFTMAQLLNSWAASIQAAAHAVGVNIPPLRLDPSLLLTSQFFDWLELEVRTRGHLVFLVDEFQAIAENFNENTLRDFMGFWKALIEKRLLSGILCGVDSMDELIAERGFANQFASMETVQVGYLDETAAGHLIVDPVLLPTSLQAPFEHLRGHSRYTTGAVRLIVDLTAGNPFFLHLICDIIVKLLTSPHSRGMLVTETVVKLAGREFLDTGAFHDRFESLTAFKPGAPFSGADELELEGRILSTIALDTRDREYCNLRSHVRSWPKRHQETAMHAISRLERNKILVSDAHGMLHKIRIGLYRLWFQQNRPFADQLAPEA